MYQFYGFSYLSYFYRNRLIAKSGFGMAWPRRMPGEDPGAYLMRAYAEGPGPRRLPGESPESYLSRAYGGRVEPQPYPGHDEASNWWEGDKL